MSDSNFQPPRLDWLPKAARYITPYPAHDYRQVPLKQRGGVKTGLIRSKGKPRLVTRKYRQFFDRRAYLESRAFEYSALAGSIQERIFYKALENHGLVMGIDFIPQFKELGGRAETGGIVPDTAFPEIKLIVPVQSYWHTAEYSAFAVNRDAEQQMILEGLGWTVLPIWPNDIEDAVALDYWIQRNIMSQWGTNYNGAPSGGQSGNVPYMEILAKDEIYARLINKLDIILELI